MFIVLIKISKFHFIGVIHLLQIKLGVVSLGLNNTLICDQVFPGGSNGQSLILGLKRSLGEGKGYSTQYPGLGNLMDRRAWWVTVHGVVKSQIWLSD